MLLNPTLLGWRDIILLLERPEAKVTTFVYNNPFASQYRTALIRNSGSSHVSHN